MLFRVYVVYIMHDFTMTSRRREFVVRIHVMNKFDLSTLHSTGIGKTQRKKKKKKNCANFTR